MRSDRGAGGDLKEWFIIIGNQEFGPLNLKDLEREPHFTPDTLVWRKGFLEWVKARFVPELNEVFKDHSEDYPIQELDIKDDLKADLFQSPATLVLKQDPYQFLLWVLVLLLIASYFFYRFYYQL